MTSQRPDLVRGPAALLLLAFALLAGPTPEAIARTPPRSDPQELWRQFPLDTQRWTRQAPAERESAPPVAASATGGTAEEGRDGSLVTVQIAVTMLAMALVLMLTTATLAYSVRGSFEFGAYRRRRRLTPSFHEFVEAPPNAETERPERREPSARRTFRIPSRARRSVKRPTAAKPLASIISEVDALKAKLDVDAAPKKHESPAHDRIQRLRARLDMHFASAKNETTASDEVESLRAKLEMHPAPAKSQRIAQDELDTLREKLDVQPAHNESAPPDEVQTLKEKLEMQPAAAKSGSTPHDELETLKAKLAKQASFANAERETADEVALKEKLRGDAAAAAKRETTVRPALEMRLVDHDPGPKLEVSDPSAKDQTRGSVDVDPPDTTLREPPGDRAADATPKAPRLVSAATPRSTIVEALYEHGSDLAPIVVVIMLALLLLLNIAVWFGIGVAS